MEKIALPKQIKFEKGDVLGQGSVIIEPCYPGYGITLGNSLRRVLISSLPGAAVIGVKIKGASHEFMTVPHVKEDVLEIILNLKGLRLKLHSDEVVVLKLEVHGEKNVTAANIEKNSLVEIANPELEIATITDMSGSLSMEIFVQAGRGYETIDSREVIKHEIGYIEIDSAFSPVLTVGMDVENVRVGKMTDWEKLVLNITTDGTISTENAFQQAVAILTEQFNALAGVKLESKAETKKEVIEVEVATVESSEGEDDDEPKKGRGRPKKDE
ncbi:MAG: DNA-directed RNA polymerase subunit alpha [bacterium]